MRIANGLAGVLAVAVVAACATQQAATPSVLRVEPVAGIKVADEARKVISVMKFDDRTVDSADFRAWQLGIPDMIMEALGAIPYYKVISREYLVQKVLDEQQFQMAGVTDAPTAVRLGKLLNAQFIVVGSFAVMRDNLQINAKVMSVESGEIVAQASSNGRVDGFYALHSDVAIKITEAFNLSLDDDARARLRQRHDTTVVAASLANYGGQDKVEQMKTLERQKLTSEAAKAKDEARTFFESAVRQDANYEKAKKNLARLSLAIPMTL
jgi:TolB-like protein